MCSKVTFIQQVPLAILFQRIQKEQSVINAKEFSANG
jgi:hypothetical protein